MKPEKIPLILLIGRPASGKSEIIDYLSKISPQERIGRFHLGDLDVIDDFPMLWTWFEEDHILSYELGKPRLYTNEEGDFKYPYLWHLLIRRLGLEYHKRLRDDPGYHQQTTTIIEFSRGSQHGGYRQAFLHLPNDLLKKAVVIYVRVSFEESLRKNRNRFNPERPDSILEHGLPDAKLERLYRDDDWDAISSSDPDFLEIQDFRVPYAVFENEDDVTTDQPQALADRLQGVCERLQILLVGR
jgi:energy-coupling factor transporter ATP-binding protein EcfA2